MRGSIAWSGVAHLMVLVALIIARPPTTYVIPGPDVVQVSMVDPSAPLTPAPAPAPKVETPDPKLEVKPAEETGVKIAPAEKPKKKPEKKTVEPQRAEPAAVPALPGAPVGSSGLRGDLSLDAGNFEFTYYLVLIRNKIASNWSPPAGLSTGGNLARAVVYFRINRGGYLSGVRLETPSGLEFFDRQALRAVTLSEPLPSLPVSFVGGELGVHFGFEWESP